MEEGQPLVDLLLGVRAVIGEAALQQVAQYDELLLLLRRDGNEPVVHDEAAEHPGFERRERPTVGAGEERSLLRRPLQLADLAATKRWPEDPRSTIFVDDVEPNIAVAAELGMLTLRFMGPAALRADLRALGLLGGPAASGADSSDQT